MTGTLNSLFVILLAQDGTDEVGDGVPDGEDAYDVGEAPDFAVEALDGVG